MRLQLLLQIRSASEDAVVSTKSLLHVNKERAPAASSNYLYTSQYPYQISSEKDLCRSIYEKAKKKNSSEECLNIIEIKPNRNVCLQVLSKVVGHKPPKETDDNSYFRQS